MGYIIFYNFSYYLSNPLDVFKIWQGGMSFHGALIGVVVGTYLFSNKVKLNSFFFLDIIACVAPTGIFFGRIANFLYGLFRIISEQFREPDTQIGYLFNLFSMGSILSFFMILIGLLILKKAKNNEFSK